MQQRCFDFEQSAESARIAEATSLQPPEPKRLPPPLVRSDRQLTFDGLPHYQWPKPGHDREAISVDRIREDIDGPSHRFVIRRGDSVEVFFGANRTDVGEVTAISHRNQEARVSFHEGSDGIWVDAACVYPTAEDLPFRGERGVPCSKVVARANVEPPEGFSESDRVQPFVAKPTPRTILRFLISSRGQEFSTSELRRQFGCVEFDPAHPLQNLVHLALQTLRGQGQIHVVEPRWGEPRISVLKLPNVADDLTLADCPRSLSGPEVRRLFVKHRRLIADFAKKYGFTQKHVRGVFERGLNNQNAVRDWLEAILPRRESVAPSAQLPATSDTLIQTSYTFEDSQKFRRSFAAGELSYADYQAQFARLYRSHDEIVSELTTRFKATELAAFASRMGTIDAKRSTKSQNAESIYRRTLASFTLDGVVSYSMGERYEEAVQRKVEAVTPEAYEQAFAERRTKAAEREKALSNPETFFEFRTFLQRKAEADLTDEQLAHYDALHADMTRGNRESQSTTTVEQFQSTELEDCEFQVKEGYHDKRQCPVWIVQLSTRVERSAFDELNRKAKMLGGWYSSFKRSDAGFQFLDEERAKRFTELLSGNVDRSDVLEDRKERRELTAAERLHELAQDLAARAEDAIERSGAALQNTARRADIQAGVRGRAYADQALSRTIHSIAEALSRGDAKYLDGIRHKSQVETLDSVLSLAKWARMRAAKKEAGETNYSPGGRLDRIEEEPIGPQDVRFTAYPFPCIYKQNLTELVERTAKTRGVKQASEKMRKRLSREQDDFVTLREGHDIESLVEFLVRAKVAGLDVERIETTLEKFNRLKRANIHDVHELRAALREYLHHRAETRGDDPVKVAERELIGKDLSGFFPTPRPVIDRMLELAQIQPEHRVLEPSCGKGDILDAVKAEYPDIVMHAVEQNRTLADVLAAKGHEVEFGNFFEHGGEYDRVVMNPPFCSEETAHVQHAFSLLAPGGRVVSVMSEGPFFRADRLSSLFREWFEAMDGQSEPLPENAFSSRESFRRTGVRTRLIIMDKGGK